MGSIGGCAGGILHVDPPEGGSAQDLPPSSEMLDEYHSYRDWDRNVILTKAKLDELGLAGVTSWRSPID